MRFSNEIAMGIRHVGKADEADSVMRGPVGEVVKRFIEYLGDTTMMTRIEVVIARDEATVLERFAMPQTRKPRQGQGEAKESLLSMLEEFMPPDGEL